MRNETKTEALAKEQYEKEHQGRRWEDAGDTAQQYYMRYVRRKLRGQS